jgi:beta-mannosidase
MARVASVSSHEVHELVDWRMALVAPGAAETPAQLAALGPAPEWLPARAPGTAASALRAAGRFSFDAAPDLDAHDVWWTTRLPALADGDGARVLCCAGLATLAEVFLDGEKLGASDSMFVRAVFDLGARAREGAELAIRFRALAPALKQRRPRPRWKTRLVAEQNLRWFRTTLAGRMPGWYPPLAPVGPFRPVTLERHAGLRIESAAAHMALSGDTGVIDVGVDVFGEVRSARLRVGAASTPMKLAPQNAGGTELRGAAKVYDAPRWSPHTHGAQPLVPVAVACDTPSGEITIDLGKTGFRALDLDQQGGRFDFLLDGAPLFLRGAVWTPPDPFALSASPAALRAALQQVRAAGVNLLRVGGTFVYEQPEFHELCDELGILVWQDLMFANMDYPADDVAFQAAAGLEAALLASRLQLSPSLALFCGSSEVEQQAAMLGLSRETWQGPLFTELLPNELRPRRPDVPYITSSPTGGVLPFQVDHGVSHYYGVGAYLRPLEDARHAAPRFCGECLAFANVPEPRTMPLVLADGQVAPHHPAWKARVPRDRGTGWDFDDVRDHYLKLLTGLDPERYLALSREVTGEVMARTFAEWRRPRSTCSGALVWLWRDPWPGAGWGVVDATGWPKAAYWHLARALAPLALFVVDEGLNGLRLHALNERPTPAALELSVRLWRAGDVQVAEATRALALPAHGAWELSLDELLGRFADPGFVYRFGPPTCELVHAALVTPDGGAAVAEAFHFPLGMPTAVEEDVGLAAEVAAPAPDGTLAVTVRTRRFAQAVTIDAPGYRPSDDHFHLAPGASRSVRLVPDGPPVAPYTGRVAALNARAGARFALPKP